MTKKKPSRNLFEFLVQQPWWLSMAGAVLITLGFAAFLPTDKRALAVAAGLPFLMVGLVAAKRQWTGPSAAKVAAAQEKALAMNWPEFSAHLTRALESNGYKVKPYDGKGADFEISKPGRRMLLACKRWKAATLGVEPLRELQTAAQSKGMRAMMMTMGRISPAAFEYAAKERIDLMDADGVAMMLASTK